MAKNLKQSRFKKVDDKEKNNLKRYKEAGRGILFVDCPACGFRMKYKNGRKRNPKLEDVSAWLDKAQCPKCGQPIRVRDPKGLSKGKGINRI